jgi:hypothetical protein
MWQPFTKIPIHPGARNRAQERDQHDGISAADLRKKRPRTSPRDGPTDAKQQAADNQAFVKFFVFNRDGVAGKGFEAKTFDDLHGNHAYDNRRADHSVHVERGQLEHLLDAKP